MAITIKTMQRLLYMVKVHQWPIRTNLTPNDLANKQYLLSILYSYSIYLIMIKCLLNIFTRTLLGSIISYHNSVLLIIIKFRSSFSFLTDRDMELHFKK
jgi:hypothetical protein